VLFARGIGLGAVMITLMGGAFVGLKREEIPAASSISRVAQQVGGSVGTAVLIMILERTSAGALTADALASGFADAFWWAAAFTAAAIPLCLLLPGQPSLEPQEQEAMPDEEPVEV
jgi:hypothetical protein